MALNCTSKEDPCLEHNFRGHKSSVTGLSFHPTNKQVASSSTDNSIVIWNLQSNSSRCYVFIGHEDTVTDLQYSSNGQLLVSCSYDSTIRLWVPRISGKCTSFRGHMSRIQSVAFNSDGLKLVSGANDKTVKLWQTSRRKFISCLSGHTHWVRCVRFSPDDSLVASCADDRTLRLWDPRAPSQHVHTFNHTKGNGTHCEFHPSGTAVGLALDSGSVKVYDVRMMKLRQSYLLHGAAGGEAPGDHLGGASSISWHPSGNFLLSAGRDGSLKIVDVLEGRPLYTIRSHNEAVNTCSFSNCGKYFATGSDDKHVMIWKTNFISEDSEL